MLKARSKLGKYKILERIGHGGFATVYKALDTVEGVHVALKVPHPHLVSDETLALFRHEARLHAGLDHPNILSVKSAELIDGQLVIASQLGQRTLANRLRSRMAMSTLLTFAAQMLEAVSYAHAHKVIHRDLKPDNFILFPGDRLRLADFSISKISLRTVRGSGSGTLGYMSPEQAMAGHASFRSDVFSLGLIFYEMLTGQAPEWPFDWPPPDHDKLRKKVHPDFITLLRKALQVDPTKRYRDAGQMLAAFQRVKPKMSRFVLRHKQRRTKAQSNTTRLHWKQVRFRHFLREFRPSLSLDRSCTLCQGPMSEAMSNCPWCGAECNNARQDVTFPDRCPRCHGGRKLDWRFCAWCFGPGFAAVDERTYSDRRYEATCAHCKSPLMRFMRYCPGCRRKTQRPWKVRGLGDRCPKCSWSVSVDYWDHCPWCARTLRRK